VVLLLAPGAHAATLGFAPLSIGVGEVASVDIVLSLDAGEVASSFQAELGISGRDVAAALASSFGGPSWSFANGNDLGASLLLAMISDNTGGDRVVATLTATGLAPGVVEVSLVSALAGFDLDDPPYFGEHGVRATPRTGLIGVITVVPEPGTLTLVCLGIAALGARRAQS
jgi:hypothetical protein